MVLKTPGYARGSVELPAWGKKASLHGKIRLVSRPPNLAIEGGMSNEGQDLESHFVRYCIVRTVASDDRSFSDKYDYQNRF